MKELSILLLCLGLVGCATTFSQIASDNRTNLLQLSIGMTKENVLNIMGTKTRYANFDERVSRYIDAPINNPYRSEIMQGNNKTLEVLYYYTDIKSVDDAITDDELTPLVFDDGKLIGWGNSFLQDNVQKYEIRLR
jgi:hypothetical protein